MDLITDMLGSEPQVLPEDMPPEAPQPAPQEGAASGPTVAQQGPSTGTTATPTPEAAPVVGRMPVTEAITSAALGAAEGVMQAKDFVVETLWPKNQEAQDVFNSKGATRKWIEQQSAELKKGSVVNGIAHSIGQFGVGFIGLGKIKWAKEGLQWAREAGKVAHAGAEAARGAVAGYIFMDPQQERLANLATQYPALSNPLTRYLAADPTDTKADGRLKNAIEGIVMDAAVVSGIALVAKAIKYAKLGNIDAANKTAAEADKAFKKANPESWGPSSDLVPPDVAATVRGEGVAPEIAQGVKDLNIQPSGPVMDARQGPSMVVPPERQALNEAAESVRGMDLPKVGPTMSAERGPTMALRDGEGGPILPGNKIEGGGNGSAAAADATSGLAGERSEVLRDVGHDGGSRRRGGDAPNPPSDAPPGGLPEDGLGVPTSRMGSGRPGEALDLRGAGDGLLSVPDAEKAINRLRLDNEVLAKAGSRDEAVAAGHKFLPDGDPSSGVIPWQKLSTTDETMAWMGQVIEAQSKVINKARGGDAEGVLRDKTVQRMITRRVEDWGENRAALEGALLKAGRGASDMAADMEASFLIANRAYQDAYVLAQRISVDNFSGFGSREVALAELTRRMGLATAMYANGKAIVSNAARSMRRMRGQFAFDEATLANLKASDPEAVLGMVLATEGNAAQLTKVGQLSLTHRIINEVAGWQAANLLWGWKTQVINFLSNAAMLVWRPSETLIGSIPQSAWGKLRGDEELIAKARTIRTQSLREITYLSSTLKDGAEAGWMALRTGEGRIIPHATEPFEVGARTGATTHPGIPQWLPWDSLESVIQNTVNAGAFLYGSARWAGSLSLRAVGASDELFKTIRYRAIVLAKASVEADARGLKAGSKEYKQFLQDRVEASFDDLGRGIDEAAAAEAKASTFQNNYIRSEEGQFGAMASRLASGAAEAPIIRVILPYIRTPTNLIRYGVKLTPGLNILQKQFRMDIMGTNGAEAQARAMGQMGMSIMLASTAGVLVETGVLSGYGPQDPVAKKQWMAMGNRPGSIAWTNEDGGKTYLEISRADPIAQPLLLYADIHTLLKYNIIGQADFNGLIAATTLGLSHLIKDKTYLKNIKDVLDAATDEKKAASFFNRVVPGFLPFSTLYGNFNPDPYMHEVRTVVDALMARLPGISSELPPQRDFLGDKIEVPQGFTVSQKKPGTALTEEMANIQTITGTFFHPPAAKSESTGGIDLRDFTLESGRSAYDRYQELAGYPPKGRPLRDMLESLVKSKGYQALPYSTPNMPKKFTREAAIMDVVAKYRQVAFRVLLSESPKLREAVKAEAKKNAMKVREAVRSPQDAANAATTGNVMQGVNSLLQSFGLQ